MREYAVRVEPETKPGSESFKVVLRDAWGNLVSIPLDGFTLAEAERVAPGIAHAFNAGAHAYRSAVTDAVLGRTGVEAHYEMPANTK